MRLTNKIEAFITKPSELAGSVQINSESKRSSSDGSNGNSSTGDRKGSNDSTGANLDK
jgi:hypothetical protein